MENKLTRAKAILFDLDGTLLDTSLDLLQSLNTLLSNEDTKMKLMPDELWSLWGKGGRKIVNAVFQLAETDPRLDALTTAFNLIYQKQLHAQAQFFSGIPELLLWLQDHHIPWGIVTNRAKEFTVPFPTHLSLLSQAQCIVCGNEVTHPKPHPEPLLTAAKLISTPPSDCAFVGDSYEDYIAGKQAHMTTIFASYGFSAAEAHQNKITPDYLIDTPSHLLKLLQSTS